jgi:hypothetical protein
MKNYLIAFCFLLFAQFGKAQIYDFDSLTQHDEQFRNIAENITDTLDLFYNDEPLEVVLISDFKQLAKNKFKEEEEYQEAIFEVMFNDTVKVTEEIKIRPRGNMRKKKCLIPPLKLNFQKGEAFLKQLKHFDKMKMVLDCKRGNLYEQYLLSEYYAYRIQNIITDYAFRVRLLKVTYIDTGGRYKDITRYAFIIESQEQVNERLGVIEIESKGIPDIKTNLSVLADAYLFQYLIGNTDWSIPGLHNICIVKSTDPTIFNPYVIPYDFDYAGIVNANYAVPNDELNLENVRERLFRGVCSASLEMKNARDRVLAKKDKIYALYEEDTLLDKYNKNSTIRYIDDFFNILEHDNAFDREIIDACR